jgi:hypothetical protein
LNISGYASVGLIAIAAYLAWRKYALTKARSILWMVAAFVYLLVVRFLIVSYNFSPSFRDQILLPFYVLLVLGMFFILQLLKTYIHHTSEPRIVRWIIRVYRKILGRE